MSSFVFLKITVRACHVLNQDRLFHQSPFSEHRTGGSTANAWKSRSFLWTRKSQAWLKRQLKQKVQNTYDKEVQNGKIAKRFYWWGWGGRQGAFEVFARIEGNCPVHHCPWHCVVAKSRDETLMRIPMPSMPSMPSMPLLKVTSVTGAFTRHFWAWPSSSLSAPWRPVMPVKFGIRSETVKISISWYFWFEHWNILYLNWSHTFLRAYQLCDDESKYRWFIQQHFSCCTVLDVKPTLEGS